jgi:hypothetical protein
MYDVIRVQQIHQTYHFQNQVNRLNLSHCRPLRLPLKVMLLPAVVKLRCELLLYVLLKCDARILFYLAVYHILG